MKKKYLSILLAAVTITAAMSVYAAPSISTIMPEAPRVVEGNISAGQKVIVQNVNTAAYKNKTVADLVDKVNDDSVQMTMEDILTALGINADEQQETPDGRDVNPSLYELLTPFVDVAIQEGDNVTYESDGSIKVTLNIEAAKGAKMKDLLLMQIDQETGKVSFIPAEKLDPETGDMTVTLPSLGPVALIGKVPVVSKKATPELYSSEKVAEVADQLKDEAAGFAMTDFVKDFMETDATEIKVSDDKTIIKQELGDLPIIAEDLGFLTDSVKQLLKDSGYPGMKVLQFAFDSREDSDYLPHNYHPNCVVYTGTHDNDTLQGWYQALKEEDKEIALEYIGNRFTPEADIHWDYIRLAMRSVADTCIIPVQDYLGLGCEARINTPSTLGGNWIWRSDADSFTDNLAAKIKKITQLCARSLQQKGE